LLTVADPTGRPLRTITGPVSAGIHRVNWDLRQPAPVLPRPRPPEAADDLFFEEPAGSLVMPGRYQVSLAKRVGGVTTPLAGPIEFSVVVEGADLMNVADRQELFEFQQQVAKLDRAVSGTLDVANDLGQRLEKISRALDHTPTTDLKSKDAVRALEKRNRAILRAIRGDTALRARNENTPDSITERVGYIVDSQRLSLSKPTQTQRDSYRIASEQFGQELAKLRTMIDVDVKALDKELDLIGAPWTPGRLPEWKEK
jgi:hypothetical protein